jgi:thiol-disulfide isomerase/thioredoxin
MQLAKIVLLLQMLLGFVWAQGPEVPANILRSVLKATENINTIEYEVHRNSKGTDGKPHRLWSRILAARSPFGFQVHFQDEDSGIREMAVSDGTTTRYSSEGETGEEAPTFIGDKQVIPVGAVFDVAVTWHVLLDRAFVSTAIDSRNLVYAGTDDIEGDLCSIILYVRVGKDSGGNIEWYWISNQTGLPRAAQRVSLIRGVTRVTDRAIIRILRVNPKLPRDTFTYKPTPADSTGVATAAPEPPTFRSLQGTRLPDLEVRDAAYNSMKLPDLVGTPFLITLWAPWCLPCNQELQALAKLEPAYRGKLRVVPIAVQDSRLNVLSWMKEHPQYDFMFLTDPDLPDKNSRLSTHFGIYGIPVSVLVGADGAVIENWAGFRTSEELEQKLGRFLEPAKK